MEYISFRLLKGMDSEIISQLLLNSPVEYTKYFHPFDFNPSSIQSVLEKAVKDRFFGVELKSETSPKSELVGFYMLRGLDEGYADPMYGVFVSHLYSGKGIASLTIYHAECFCKIHGYHKLLLKVYDNNFKAKNLYKHLGFIFLREDNLSKQILFVKNIVRL
mgnify:CR=1 FL=1